MDEKQDELVKLLRLTGFPGFQAETEQSNVLTWNDSLDLLSNERKQDLAQRLWAWDPGSATEEKLGPFAQETLNGLEVCWLAACALVGDTDDYAKVVDAAQRIKAPHDDDENDSSPSFSRLFLDGAVLSKAQLSQAQLKGAHFFMAQLTGANLYGARLQGAHLMQAQLTDVNLSQAQLTGANFYSAQLTGASLYNAPLQGANFTGAKMQGANLAGTQLQRAKLTTAQLQGALLGGAQLQDADLDGAQLQGSTLLRAQLQGTRLSSAQLQGADMRRTSLDKGTDLDGATLTDVRLDGSIFDNTNLSVVDWSVVPRLQDERIADQPLNPASFLTPAKALNKDKQRIRKSGAERRSEYQAAARAYRRLSVALQANGMSDEAATYAYRAQLMQRRVHRFSRSYGRWAFSGILDALAGYGYAPGRSVMWYLATIVAFAAAYLGVTHSIPFFGLTEPSGAQPLQWYEALVLSLASFHGRGFFPSGISLGDPIAIIAAIEAVIGLLIEISFIATFTQRFFGAK